MARKDDDFLLVEEHSSTRKYFLIFVLVAVLGVGGYAYLNTKSSPVSDPAKPPMRADAVEQGESGTVKTIINFAYDSTVISDDEHKKLQAFANKVKNIQGEIKVEGYADSQGTTEYNKTLSFARAEETVAALKKSNLGDKVKVTIQGLGIDKPVASNNSEDGRAKNRRAELIFTPAK